MPIAIEDYYRVNGRLIREKGYHAIYIIGPESGCPCKIGRALDMPSRLSGLQVANWVKLEAHNVLWTPGMPVAVRLENFVHKKFKEKQLLGEWFDIDKEEAWAVVCKTAKEIHPNAEYFTHGELIAKLEHRLTVWLNSA